MSALSRDDFISSLTKELQRQADTSGNLSQVPALESAEVLNKLNYDFPSLSGNELLALVVSLEESICTPSKLDKRKLTLKLSSKLLNNLAYLSDLRFRSIGANADQSLAEAIGKLCLFIYFKVPAFILECDIEILREMFSPHTLSNAVREDENETNSDEEKDTSFTWYEILQKFAAFMQTCSASIICPTIGAGGDWFVKLLTTPSYVSSMEAIISKLGQVLSNFETKGDKNTDVSRENVVFRRFFERCESPSELIKKSTFLQNLNELTQMRSQVQNSNTMSNDNIVTERNEQLNHVQNLLRITWMHYIYICRDVLSHCPPLLQAWLPRLLQAIPYKTSATNDYPSAEECVRVLILTNLSASLMATHFQPTDITENTTTTVTKRLQAPARAMIRSLLENHTHMSIGHLVDICQRMLHGSNDGGTEAGMFVLDLSLLYLDGLDVRGMSPLGPVLIAKNHSKLIESRAFVLLIELLLSSTTFVSTSSIPNTSQLKSIAPRILECLSIAAMQHASTAQFMSRLPMLMQYLRCRMSEISNTNPSTTESQSINAAELLLLLFGLGCHSLSDIKTSITSQSSVMTEIQSMFCTVGQFVLQQIAQVVECQRSLVEKSQTDLEESEDTNNNLTIKRKITPVPGLCRTLQLMTLSQTGGTALLHSTSKNNDIFVLLHEIVQRSMKITIAAGDIKRYSKMAQSFLEGNTVHKLD